MGGQASAFNALAARALRAPGKGFGDDGPNSSSLNPMGWSLSPPGFSRPRIPASKTGQARLPIYLTKAN